MSLFLQAGPLLKPDLVVAFVLLDVAIILVAARLCGLGAQRIGQPRVVGEIVAGVLLGPTLLGPELLSWSNAPAMLHCDESIRAAVGAQKSVSSCFFPAQSRSVLGVLGQIALTFFMFLVGLELDFAALKGRVRGIITVAAGVVAVPVAAGFILQPALYDAKFVAGWGTATQPSETAFALILAAMLSVTAFPVMARILQEKGLSTSAMGTIGIAAAAVVTVLMFILTAVAVGVAKDKDSGDHVLKVVYVAIFMAVAFGLVRPLLQRTLGRVYASKGLTGDVFAAVVALAFIAAYVCQRLEISVIVGGFVAGACMPARKALLADISTRLGELTTIVLLPIFLAVSGLATDFTKLKPEFWGGIALFLVAGIVAKWGAGILFARAGGLSWAEGNVIGVLMNCRGLLVLVVALIALNEKVVTPQLQVGGVLMALVTTMMTGPLFDRFLPKAAAAAKPA